MTELTIEEKAKRYDEIQTWWWWYLRRLEWNEKPMKLHYLAFMDGLAENLEPYEGERQ